MVAEKIIMVITVFFNFSVAQKYLQITYDNILVLFKKDLENQDNTAVV